MREIFHSEKIVCDRCRQLTDSYESIDVDQKSKGDPRDICIDCIKELLEKEEKR
jgi:hypothetical protein